LLHEPKWSGLLEAGITSFLPTDEEKRNSALGSMLKVVNSPFGEAVPNEFNDEAEFIQKGVLPLIREYVPPPASVQEDGASSFTFVCRYCQQPSVINSAV
jgi:hypothetical protein